MEKICVALVCVMLSTYVLRFVGFPLEPFAQTAIIFTALALEVLVINLEL